MPLRLAVPLSARTVKKWRASSGAGAGAATLRVTVDDAGHSGEGGPRVAVLEVPVALLAEEGGEGMGSSETEAPM